MSPSELSDEVEVPDSRRFVPAARLRKLPWQARYVVGWRVKSRLHLLGLRLTHLHCELDIGWPVRLGPGFSLYIPDEGSFVVEPGVDFRRNFVCEVEKNGRVEIGAGSMFTSNTLIQCSTLVHIGRRCAFGQSTLIADGYHRYGDLGRHWADQGHDYRPIHIGDGAGISDKCTIQADVGEGALVASGSVVNRPIPPYCLAVGAPARVVRYFGPPELRHEVLSRRRRRQGDRTVLRATQEPR